MPFKLKELLDAIGQAAAVVFAAWIFMGFLQQRYAAAYERYRSLVAEVRQHGTSRASEGNLRQ